MMRGLIELAKTAEDERVRSVCLVAVLDRAGVRPIDYDEGKAGDGLAEMTDEQLAEHTATLLEKGGMPRATAWKFVKRALQLDPDG